MYSVCTGPRPVGGAYCSGNPGDGSTVGRYHRNSPSPNATVRPAIHGTPVNDRPRMRSHLEGHGRLIRGAVGTSTRARPVTGVRGAMFVAARVTVFPSTVRSRQARPTP